MGTRGLGFGLVGVAVASVVGAVLAGESAGGTWAGTSVVAFRASAPPAATPSGPAQSGPAPSRPAQSGHAAVPARPAGTAGPTDTGTPTGSPAAGRPAGNHPPARRGLRGGGPAGSMMRTAGPVALTFDDGPDPVQTPRILDLLATYRVKATFCLIGLNVQAHPELVRRIAAEGHTLCNHTWRHSLTLGRQSRDEIRADLERTNEAIRAAAPGATVRYLRAPGGNFTPAFVSVAGELGMTSIYWSIDPRDWDHPAGESAAAHRHKIISAVERGVRPGSIVLSHDSGQPETIEAYRALVPWLLRRYTLAALP
jgi:peptidoglycan-N-acetylglucosamine deacetylase